MATFVQLFVLTIFLVEIEFSSTLICPIYSSRQTTRNQHRYIRNCQKNCSFENVRSDRHACLAVFYNYSGEIFIKQLGVGHRDELCSRSTECFLDVDLLNPQILSCCCSTDNCTLTWRNFEPTTTIKTTTMFFQEKSRFSWQIFIIPLVCLFSLIFLVFALRSCRRDASTRENSTEKSSSFDQLFFSAERLVLGKNCQIYKSIYHRENVALKVYQNTHVSIWTNEMILLKSIEHDSIIKILSDGQFDSHWFLVLPFYENGNLQSFLRNSSQRTLSFDDALNWIRSLVSAVSYLHLGKTTTGLTIVHRDLKSSNVLIGENGRKICLTDFGMAAALPRILKEKDFVQIGTMRYMAPELLEGVIAHTREALCSVDIYALALVIWEILSQTDVVQREIYRPPYDEYLTNVNDRSTFSIQLYDVVVTRRLRPTFPRPVKHFEKLAEISALIDTCWTNDPELRLNAQTLTLKLEQI